MNKARYCGAMVATRPEKSLHCLAWDLHEGEASLDGFVEFDLFTAPDWRGCLLECFRAVVLPHFLCKKAFPEGGRDYLFAWWGDLSLVWEFEDIAVFASRSPVGL